MEKYFLPKSRKTQLVPVLCVFLAVMFSACGTKNPVVSDTDNLPVSPDDPAPDKTAPGAPVTTEPVQALIEMVSVKGGTFNMGFPESSRRSFTGNNAPAPWPNHYVTLNDFYIGKYEVTQGQYIQVLGNDKNLSENDINPENNTRNGFRTLPVEHTTWYDTLVFCNKLSIREKLKPVYIIDGSVDPDDWGETPLSRSKAAKWDAVRMDREANGYRLPTEAEWEYAARGGAESRNFKYAGSNDSSDVAWHSGNSGKGGQHTIHQIGSKKPNELGLYDMSGNVMEWCWDWEGKYPSDAQRNPVGEIRWNTGTYRIIRGGSYSFAESFCIVQSRHKNDPTFHGFNLGFRVARNK